MSNPDTESLTPMIRRSPLAVGDDCASYIGDSGSSAGFEKTSESDARSTWCDDDVASSLTTNSPISNSTTKRKAANITISHLPVDILVEIDSHLYNKADHHCLRITCRGFRASLPLRTRNPPTPQRKKDPNFVERHHWYWRWYHDCELLELAWRLIKDAQSEDRADTRSFCMFCKLVGVPGLYYWKIACAQCFDKLYGLHVNRSSTNCMVCM